MVEHESREKAFGGGHGRWDPPRNIWNTKDCPCRHGDGNGCCLDLTLTTIRRRSIPASSTDFDPVPCRHHYCVLVLRPSPYLMIDRGDPELCFAVYISCGADLPTQPHKTSNIALAAETHSTGLCIMVQGFVFVRVSVGLAEGPGARC